MPTASNLTGRLLQSHDHKINLTWVRSTKPINETCNLAYCAGSRRFDSRMLVYTSIPYNDEIQPEYVTEWLATAKRRQTFHIFDHEIISSDKYYVFQVRNRRRLHGYLDPAVIKSSDIHFFGRQGN